ncbi:MAG: NifB/NifX family molybdenum-iron cluster-binding protein [Bacteroidales bacterium]|nr:NifB/NifX family molybdenum-iron cluster-binding protein [Bacteroidales bacterium]
MEKYLVASSGDQLDSKISGRFGHAKFFIVINPQTMDYEAHPGVDPDQEKPDIGNFMKQGISKVLVGNIGPSAFNEATGYGLKVYLCRKMTVNESISKVYNDEISPMQEPTIKESLHSPRKADGNASGRGTGRGMDLGRSTGKGHGKGRNGDKGRSRG